MNHPVILLLSYRAAYDAHSVVSFVFAMNWLLSRLVRDPKKLQRNPIEWWDDCNRSGDCDQDIEAIQGQRVQWKS